MTSPDWDPSKDKTMFNNATKVKAALVWLEDGSLVMLGNGMPVPSNTPLGLPNVPAPVEESAPPKIKRRSGPRKKNMVKIPISECEAFAGYHTKGGKEMIVAIKSSGTRKNGSKWYKCWFVSDCGEYAMHDSGGFFASPERLSDITPVSDMVTS